MSSKSEGTAAFFLITFAFTWGLQVPGVLAARGLLPGAPSTYMPFAGLGIFGPLVAAVVLTRRGGDWSAVKQLFRPLLRYRVHPGWYLMALLVPGVLLSSGLFVMNLAGRDGPISYVPALGALGLGLVISVGEEVGWRGYALPRLQKRWGAFGASCLIGVLWYLWHIPMFVGLGVPLDLVFVMFLYFTGASMVLTWIYNGSRGSLLLAVLAHWGAHLNNSHRALPGEVLPLVVHAIVYAGLGLLVMRGTLQGRTPRWGRRTTVEQSSSKLDDKEGRLGNSRGAPPRVVAPAIA